MQPRSNESQYSRKNELEGKGSQGERHTSIAGIRRPLVRSPPGSWTEKNRTKCRKETLGLKDRGNLNLENQRGSIGRSRDSRVLSENFRQEEVQKWSPDHPVQKDTTRRTSSIQRKHGETTVQTLRRGAKKVKQQEYSRIRDCQERKGGADSNRSLSLEVLVEDVNYKTLKSGL
ncbi:hypothetical protein TNCV_1648471 [Trichonephila clavipes]|uniref:Uncharacterized protein n=1 Tax=Trichonephila clavipes TaxID=2585209 RepID=A0A8X6V6K1_TRICX|nr:hypothetical protein TNCV_1648471 [Trichonephila clavipes]